jgi:siroheme synthase (precorrin-2 oxidase/ferrochelatase)
MKIYLVVRQEHDGSAWRVVAAFTDRKVAEAIAFACRENYMPGEISVVEVAVL